MKRRKQNIKRKIPVNAPLPPSSYANSVSTTEEPSGSTNKTALLRGAQAVNSSSWLLLIYKMPPEPAKKRIAVWRRLKSMGAVYLQNGVCLVPKADDYVRRLKMLENEIAETAGECVILETAALDRVQMDKVIARFKADRDEEYKEFLVKCGDFEMEIAKETAASHLTYAELEENDVDLKKLQAWLEKIHKTDFYGASLRADAEKHLRKCEILLEEYAQRVFEARDENR